MSIIGTPAAMGGEPPKILQDKTVSLQDFLAALNGTGRLEPDTGYDGFSSVTIEPAST